MDSNPARRVFTKTPAVGASVITALAIRTCSWTGADHVDSNISREQKELKKPRPCGLQTPTFWELCQFVCKAIQFSL
jgi:hypothetical protein